MKQKYIISADEIFHDEMTTTSLLHARKLKKALQRDIDKQAAEVDAVPDDVRIYKLVLVE